MKYVTGFRNQAAAETLTAEIHERFAAPPIAGRPLNIMEVCGTHTVCIARYGIRGLLPTGIHLVSGPGCPVCVTDPGYIDAAIALAASGATLVTFGDLLAVPGSTTTLADARAAGADVRVVYGPTDAFHIATSQPGRPTVFLAVGFETTAAPLTSLLPAIRAHSLHNLTLLTAFKTVPPALLALLTDPDLRINAFICPAHVSAIIGAAAYQPIAARFHVPCVVAGFEPLDILLGIKGILDQIASAQARVDNQYSRVVRTDGNPRAQALMARHLTPINAHWRGIGIIPHSGLAIRDEFSHTDAAVRHGITIQPGVEHPACRCGDVIKGKITPRQCPLFGKTCTPEKAVGPCMVSSEGSCAAQYRYTQT